MESTEGSTEYILMKRCTNCWYISEATRKTCTQCGYLFISEATEKQKQQANKRLADLKEKRKKKKESDLK